MSPPAAGRKPTGPEPAAVPRRALARDISPVPTPAASVVPFPKTGVDPTAPRTRSAPRPLPPAAPLPPPRNPAEVTALHAAYGNAAIGQVAARQAAPSALVEPPPRETAAAGGAVSPPTPRSASPGGDAATQKSAGAIAGGMAAAGGGTAEAVAAPGAYQAMAPAIAAIRHRAAVARRHPPAGLPIGRAEAAGTVPAVKARREAAHATMKEVDGAAQRSKEAERAAFKASLRRTVKQAIASNMATPKTKAQADEVMEQGAARANATMGGQLATDREAATGPLKSAAGTEISAPTGLPPAPGLQPEEIGAAPAPVAAAAVVPTALPAQQLDFSADRAPTDKVMAENGITTRQLEEGNEPAFASTLTARAAAEKHEAGLAARYRHWEGREQGDARGAAQQALTAGLSGMHAIRSAQIAQVVGQQFGVQNKNLDERQRITGQITQIKNETLTSVNNILASMETDAARIFATGLADAEELYDKVFKKAKGGAWNWLTNWGSDWDDLIESSLATAQREYERKVDETIDQVGDFIYGKLTEAKLCVADGLKRVETFVGGWKARPGNSPRTG
jgi:hypothetical protein